MTENGTDWRLVAAEEARQRNKAEEALVEMRRFLFDYFHLLGPDPLENINVVVRTLGKVLGSDVALYNRLENGISVIDIDVRTQKFVLNGVDILGDARRAVLMP